MKEEERKEKEEERKQAVPEQAATPEDEERDEEEKDASGQEEFEHPDYDQELIALIRSDLPVEKKRERLADYHYSDMADAVEQLAPD